MPIERKRTLTLNLSDEEMDLLEAVADRLGMSKSAVLRQAIRLYEAHHREGRDLCAPPS